MSSKYDYRKIPKKKIQTKKEKEKNEKIFNIIVFVVSLIIVLYVFYATIYIAGDHEHIITVTEKELIDTGENKYYYIHGINEKGKEKKYEISSDWIFGREQYVNSEIWDEIQEGCTYRVRATGLCWGLEAEPLLHPIIVENKGAEINDIKNPVPIAGILSLIYVLVSSFMFINFAIKKPEFFQKLVKYEDVDYPSQYNSRQTTLVREYGVPILKRERITIRGIILVIVIVFMIRGPQILIAELANWYYVSF